MEKPILKHLPEDYFVPFLQSSLDVERSIALKDQIVRHIRDHGPMPFTEFMHESLYGHLGFYSARAGGVGQGTPFLADTTSPEQDDLFAQVIADRISLAWREMGRPSNFDVVEMGAGTGALACDILQTTLTRHPEAYASLRYIIVDVSPALIELQRARLQTHQVRWIYGSAAFLPLRNVEGIMLSNELVDSLLFHRIVLEKGHLREIYVDEKDGELVDRLDRPSQEFRDYFKTIGFKPEEGVEMHVCLDASKWMTGVARALRRGYVMTIDYGDRADRVHGMNGPWHDSALAGTNYRLDGSEQKAIYERVGGVDITTYVDFTILMKIGERLGLSSLLVTQLDFLSKAGADATVAANLQIGEISTSRNLERISQLFNARHKVLIQAKGAA